jgi:hypothetical protein
VHITPSARSLKAPQAAESAAGEFLTNEEVSQ